MLYKILIQRKIIREILVKRLGFVFKKKRIQILYNNKSSLKLNSKAKLIIQKFKSANPENISIQKWLTIIIVYNPIFYLKFHEGNNYQLTRNPSKSVWIPVFVNINK